MRKSVTIAGALGAGSAVAIGAFAIVATRASGGAAESEPAPPIVKTELVKAVLEIGAGEVEFRRGNETSAMQATFAPAASTGWHRHPGTGMFLVNSGTVTTYGLDGPACEPAQVGAGKSLLFTAHADHPHLVRNESAEPVTFTVLYFDLEPGQPGRADAPAPEGCPDLR